MSNPTSDIRVHPSASDGLLIIRKLNSSGECMSQLIEFSEVFEFVNYCADLVYSSQFCFSCKVAICSLRDILKDNCIHRCMGPTCSSAIHAKWQYLVSMTFWKTIVFIGVWNLLVLGATHIFCLGGGGGGRHSCIPSVGVGVHEILQQWQAKKKWYENKVLAQISARIWTEYCLNLPKFWSIFKNIVMEHFSSIYILKRKEGK